MSTKYEKGKEYGLNSAPVIKSESKEFNVYRWLL